MCPPLLFGTAAVAGTSTTAAIAAKAGLFGAGGAFGLGQTLTTLGTIGSAGGMLYQGQVAASNLEYQSGIMDYNRVVAENDAMMAEWSAENDADIYDDRARRLMSTQTTKYAKSGVVINQDTPLDVAADTVAQAQLERLAILYRGQTQSNVYQQKAEGLKSGAARGRANITPTRVASGISAISTLGKGAGTSLLS